MVMGRNECGSNAMVTGQETKSRLHFCRHPRPDRESHMTVIQEFWTVIV